MLIRSFIVLLVPVALAFPTRSVVERDNECTGALTACKNIQSAQSCKAVRPCVQIWEKLQVPEDNNEICDLCKEMVKEARDQLMSNETQDEIKQVFEGSCNLIPIKALAQECISVVDQLIPTLIETLASRMDPNQVCTVAGLCNNGKLEAIMKSQLSELAPILLRAAVGNNDKCTECKSSMTFAKKIINLIGLDGFTQLTFQTCQKDFHGSITDCAKLINGVLPAATFISQNDEKSICSALRTCEDPEHKGDLGCLLCKEFVGSAANLPQIAMKSIEDFFVNQCSQIESDVEQRHQCEAVVKSTLQIMIQYLWSKDDPSLKCKKAGICLQTKVKTEPKPKHVHVPTNAGDSEVCEVCHEIFKYIRDKAMTLTVKEEIHKEVDQLCAETGQFGPVCQSFVDQYFDYIYDSICAGLTPDVVCIVLKLCNNQRAVAVKVGQTVCSICELYRSIDVTVKDRLLLSLKREAEFKLEKLCKTEFHGTNVEQCEAISKDVIPVVYHYLKSMDPSTFCGAMKSCPWKNPLPKPIGDNLTCEFCESLVQYVRNVFTSASTKEEFRTAFTNMCQDLREFSSECSSLVSEYFDQVYDFVTGQMDPKLVCSALGLCGPDRHTIKMVKMIPAKTTSSIDIFPAMPIIKQVDRVGLRIIDSTPEQYEEKPGIKVHLPESSKKTNRVPIDDYDIETNQIDDHQPQQLPPERFLHPSVISQNDFACTICKTVINLLEQELSDEKTEDEIRNALDKVCSYLPKELGNECQDFINEYTDMIVNLLIQQAPPGTICSLLRVCQEGSSIKAIPVQPNGMLCEVCVKIMAYVEQEIESNSTEEAIKKALDEACSYLPSPYGSRCQEFMDKYSEMIFELLSKEVAPRMVCTLIGICPFGENKQNGEVECQICQYTLHFIQGRLMDNATAEEIKQALENVCQQLPQKVASECKTYIEQYGNAILALIAQEIDPSVICVKLNICPAISHQETHMAQTTQINDLKIDTCGTCQIVVDYMDKLLENDDVDREIVKLVEKVCKVVPASTRDQCTTIIEAYGPYILQMIGQLADKKEVCQTIDLCDRVPGQVHLLGAEKCSFGPAYWCKSSAHASACKAEMYCKQKVWGA